MTVISEDTFMLVYCSDRYKIQRMCDEVVGDCLGALQFISVWFVTSKVIKKLLAASYADDNIFYFNEDSGETNYCSDARRWRGSLI